MISLILIGLGLIIIALRFVIARNSIRRGQQISESTIKEIREEAILLLSIGIFILVIAWLLSSLGVLDMTESQIIVPIGATLAFISISSWLQVFVQQKRGTIRQINIGVTILSICGIGCIIIYVIYRIMNMA